MTLKKMYLVTIGELVFFVLLASFLAPRFLRNMYEGSGIAYEGNIGALWLGLAFLMFCLTTLVRDFLFSEKSYLLKDRVTSFTFWLVFVWSLYTVFSPFVTGTL